MPVWAGAVLSGVMLAAGLGMEHLLRWEFFEGVVRAAFFGVAYLPVGVPVLRAAWRGICEGDFFTEFSLMGLATLCAFLIGQYAEGVAVMLFYAVGEHFQEAAAGKARRSVEALLDLRPERARVRRGGEWVELPAREVNVGEVIQVRAGERAALDGELLGERAVFFNTAALTGESVPREVMPSGKVLAGMICVGELVELRVSGRFEESALARILELVENAVKAKARPELFIRKFARVYTPVVVALAAGLVVLPMFWVENYVLREWLYRACVFLVVSCPCALVISIPLAYFGGIGAAARRGVLFKGSVFLDLVTRVDTVVLDKTGTVTRGVFGVRSVLVSGGFGEEELLGLAAGLEQGSTHPVARAVCEEAGRRGIVAGGVVERVVEVAGRGLRGRVGGREVLVGKEELLRESGVELPAGVAGGGDETVVCVAVDGVFAGSVRLADGLKEDAKLAVELLRRKGVKRVELLSGDRSAVVEAVARELGVDGARGDLLPEGKVERIRELREEGRVVAFVGDGINDAPALAASDIGMAMGGLGSDAAIETADVVIQTDHPSRIATAIEAGRRTRRVLWENVGLAFAVKGAVLLLGAWGVATMWEAVFADVGVALLAILNAVRLQRMRF